MLVVVSSMSVRVYYGQADVVRKPFDPTATGVQSPATTPLESKTIKSLDRYHSGPSTQQSQWIGTHQPFASSFASADRAATADSNGHRPELLQRMLKGESKRFPLLVRLTKPVRTGQLSSCLGLNPPDVKPLQKRSVGSPRGTNVNLLQTV